MTDGIKRICLWSGPRNISTALMYSFARRPDTRVFDEPLYAHYLSNSPAVNYHPMAQEILVAMEKNGDKVVRFMQTCSDKPVLFFKQMTHHLVGLEWDFLPGMTNIILTRDPREMLPSYAREIENPVMADVGYAMHTQLLDYLNDKGLPPVILDSKRLLMQPELTLKKLCGRIGIPFREEMLSWPAGPIPEDGVWAPHWYANVHRSTGFNPYTPKNEKMPESLIPLLKECEPHYRRLAELSI